MRPMRWSWILKLLVGLGVILTVGSVSTRFLVSDGLAQFTGEGWIIAQDALMSAELGCLDHPIERMLSWKIRVVDVNFEPGPCPEADPSVHQDYRAVLRTYTFFGIPTGTLSVSCGEVNCGY